MMLKVLCIEDEPDLRRIIVEELQDAGYETYEAGDGQRGLEAMKAYHPGLVLSDISMPAMSGLELLKEVKDNNPELACIPFVFLSALADRKSIVEGKELGADDYVAKPIDFDILFATVKSRLRQVTKWQELWLIKEQAERADRAKSEFLAMLSHELRTPLNAIIGFSGIIASEILGPVGSDRYRLYAVDINESGRHLLALINDILDLSKVESGTQKLYEEDIDVPEIIKIALKLARHHAENCELKLELGLPEALPLLRADERKVKQILVNLLTNAIKFTQGGEVTLRAWCHKDSGFVFQIVDTGIGIAAEDIPAALSRFGQVDSGLNRKYGGTGLGLPLSKALVELHGGSLDLQSKVGVGTTVTVRFPADRIVASLDNAYSLDVEVRATS